MVESAPTSVPGGETVGDLAGQGCQHCQVLEFSLAILTLRTALLGWKSKVVIVVILRDPYLAMLVIGPTG